MPSEMTNFNNPKVTATNISGHKQKVNVQLSKTYYIVQYIYTIHFTIHLHITLTLYNTL